MNISLQYQEDLREVIRSGCELHLEARVGCELLKWFVAHSTESFALYQMEHRLAFSRAALGAGIRNLAAAGLLEIVAGKGRQCWTLTRDPFSRRLARVVSAYLCAHPEIQAMQIQAGVLWINRQNERMSMPVEEALVENQETFSDARVAAFIHDHLDTFPKRDLVEYYATQPKASLTLDELGTMLRVDPFVLVRQCRELAELGLLQYRYTEPHTHVWELAPTEWAYQMARAVVAHWERHPEKRRQIVRRSPAPGPEQDPRP
jgi:hypothetical protein